MQKFKDLNYMLPNYNQHFTIIANGQFPQEQFILDYIKNSRLIIACDGAINQLINLKIKPDYSIGDSDSLDEFNLHFAINPHIHIEDQNTNDLTKAVNFVHSSYGSKTPLIIVAASGMREDHTIANFALLEKYHDLFENIAMLSDHGILEVYPSGTHGIPCISGQQISLFSFSRENKITAKELKWPLKNSAFDFLYSGTLNQTTKDHLELQCSEKLIVYRAFEIKEL